MSHCLVQILVQRRNWARRGRYSQRRSLSGHVERIFVHQKLKKRILAAFGFNRTALRATQPKLHSIFWVLFLKIVLSAAELMSFGHLGAANSHRWTIICGVPSKISVTPETIDVLKDNTCEAIGEIQLHTNRYVKKLNRSRRLLHGHPRQPWNYFPLLPGRIILSNKKEI